MKNKFSCQILMILAILFIALPSFAQNTNMHDIRFIASKFGFAMGGVLIFSFLLYFGLSIYNKYFVDEQIKDFKLRKDSLRTPRDIEEAVMMFIAKNRMK